MTGVQTCALPICFPVTIFGAVSNRDLEEIDKYFQQLIEFLSYEKSEFEYVESTGNKKVDDMFKRWNQQIKSFDKRAKDDMRVLGEIFISVKKNKSSVEILIEDNGGGIADKEILKSIFDIYFTTKKESYGTGIGLYMTKIIIEQNLGGKIKAKNQNNGLKFKIKLPILTI